MGKFWKKSKSEDTVPGPSSENPYAQQGPPNDPYAADSNKYDMAPSQRMAPGGGYGLPSGPRAGGGLPSRPSPAVNGRSNNASFASNDRYAASSNASFTPANEGYSSSKEGTSTSSRGYSTPSSTAGYGSDRYGAPDGYGSNRYGNPGPGGQGNARGPGGYGGTSQRDDSGDDDRARLFGNRNQQNASAPQENRYRQPAQAGTPSGPGYGGNGGYGGMRQTNSDTNRDELFSGAAERAKSRQAAESNGVYGESNQSGVDSGSYGGYGEERELTEEEKLEAQVRQIKLQTSQTRDATIASQQNAIAHGQRGIEAMMSSMQQLGSQGDRLQRVNAMMDQAKNQNKVAKDSADALQFYNSHMIGTHRTHAFGKKGAKYEAERAARHAEERAEREGTAKSRYAQNRDMQGAIAKVQAMSQQQPQQRKGPIDYEFEDSDEEQQEKERQIDAYVGVLEHQSRMMNVGAHAIGDTLQVQNATIDKITEKANLVDDGLTANTRKLGNIR